MHMLLWVNFGYKSICRKHEQWIFSSWLIIELLTVVIALMIHTCHCLNPDVQCEKSPMGEAVESISGWTSSQTKCEASLLYMHQLNLSAFPRDISVDLSTFDGCFAISSISVFIILFLLVLSGLLWNPPLLLSFSQIFLFRHDSKSPFNLSSASQMGLFFLSLIHFLFLHKHICSSEWAGIAGALCF